MSITLNVATDGQIILPSDLRERYQLTPNTPVRLIETRNGILLVPLTGAPMSEELAQEIGAWQALAGETFDLFPYKEPTP